MLTLCILVVAALSERASAEDWPRWRGPRGDGTWNGPKLAETWPKEGLKAVWRQPIGGGYAGVTVAGGRVFVLDRQTEPAEVERVLCFDARSGEPLWTRAYAVEYGKLDYGSGPRAAAVVDGDRVYTVGTIGHVHCLNVQTGEVLWKTHLLTDWKGRLPMWGFAASPLVVDDAVILQPGGEGTSVIALDKRNGTLLWKTLSDEAGYAAPVLIQHQERRQLIVWTPSDIRSVDPADGTPFWQVPYPVTYGVAIATPVFAEGLVFVSGYWEGSKTIRLGDEPTDAELLWEENRYLRGLMSQPLTRGGHAYLLDKAYGLTCLELQTGKKRWDDDNRLTPRGRNPQASLVWLGETEQALCLNSDGELVLARINPQGYEELARAKIIGETWAHPAYAGSYVYARSDTELVAIALPLAR